MPLRKSQHRVMHIKRNTAGTSNELSFSVLDAKKNKAGEGGQQSPRTVEEFGKVAVFTLPDKQHSEGSVTAVNVNSSRKPMITGQRTYTNLGGYTVAEEVASRKRRRRASRVLNVLAVVAIVGVVALAAGSLFTREARSHQDAQSILDEAVALLEQTDEFVLDIDNRVAQPATDDPVFAEGFASEASEATTLLNRAANYAIEVSNLTDNGELKEVAFHAKEASTARKSLIEQGRRIIEESTSAQQAATLAQQAWDLTLEGDELAKKATAAVSQTTEENARRSTEFAGQAAEKFAEARSLLSQAKGLFPAADFSDYEEYLDARAGAQTNAIASNAAVADQDRNLAEVNSAAYNEAEERAAKLAQKLPADPAQPVLDAYAISGAAANERYQEVRARASRADASLRKYLQGGGA